jgi:hypothetical protein
LRNEMNEAPALVSSSEGPKAGRTPVAAEMARSQMKWRSAIPYERSASAWCYAEAGGARGGDWRVMETQIVIGADEGAVHDPRTGTGSCAIVVTATTERWTVWQIWHGADFGES